jgi:hypothetical protein
MPLLYQKSYVISLAMIGFDATRNEDVIAVHSKRNNKHSKLLQRLQ